MSASVPRRPNGGQAQHNHHAHFSSPDQHKRSQPVSDSEDSHGEGSSRGDHRHKKQKRSSGKACVYCRRSHMVCEGGRPCGRCIKRDIANLCRDVTPPSAHRRESTHPRSTASPSHPTVTEPVSPSRRLSELDPSLYADANFPPSWPLLPDSGSAPRETYVDGTGGQAGEGAINRGGQWGMGDDTELGALSKFLGELGVPSLPGSFLDVLSYFGKKESGNNMYGVPVPGVTDQRASRPASPIGQRAGSVSNGAEASKPATATAGKGKQKASSGGPPELPGVSRVERYFLAAADQPSGPRASRLAQVIKAKYDAGLLKPYDYIKGYERMNKWMDSGRAAPKEGGPDDSRPLSPVKKGTRIDTPNPVTGSSISPESRRRILTALNGFRPKFRQIARTLTDVDLVFVEEAMERWMLEYDRAFASIHTPSCIWRRTGEIQKANQEFSNLTGVSASMFRNGQLCIYELMDEDSAVRYWEGYAKVAFDAGQRSMYMSCTLKIPHSLIRHRPRLVATPMWKKENGPAGADGKIPELDLPATADGEAIAPSTAGDVEKYTETKCCFSVTIRRDAWGVPVAIMGQWIVQPYHAQPI